MPLSHEEFKRRLKQLWRERKIVEAHLLLEQTVSSATGVPLAEAKFNLGVSWRSELGNGVEARKRFNEVGLLATQLPVDPGLSRDLIANACGNSMLLALSYEEYEEWANALRQLRPTDDQLLGQYPPIMDAKRQGRPWSDALRSFAGSYFSDGSPSDRKLWSEAAATYQLMLENRQRLRLDRGTWGEVIVRYTTLCLRLGTRACPTGATVGSSECPENPLRLITQIAPYLDDYLKSNPNDPKVLEVQGWMRQQVARFSAPAAQGHSAEIASTPQTPSPSSRLREAADGPMKWTIGTMIALVIAGVAGAGIGSLVGGLVFVVFMSESVASNFHAIEVPAGVVPAAIIGATTGMIALAWCAMIAGRGGLGFRVATSDGSRHLPLARSSLLGALYGAALGAYTATLLSNTITFSLSDQPNTAGSPWITTPYWALLAELGIGAVLGVLTGAIVGLFLALGRQRATRPLAAAQGGPWVLGRLLPFAISGGTFVAVVGVSALPKPLVATGAWVFALSTGALTFVALTLCAAGLLLYANANPSNPTQEHRPFWAPPAWSSRSMARGIRLAGMFWGAAVGLRLSAYAMVVSIDPTGATAWRSVVASAAAGLMFGLLLTPRDRPTVARSPSKGRLGEHAQRQLEFAQSIRRPGAAVLCSNGHTMQPFDDEGILLAVCPQCGAAKPYPGAMLDGSSLIRVMAKYERFEL
jgi:hypothetical protein